MHGGSRVWGRAFQGPRPLSGLATALLSDLQQGPAPLDPSRAMVPNLFWYQEPESWKTIFPRTWVGVLIQGTGGGAQVVMQVKQLCSLARRLPPAVQPSS